MEKLLQNLAKIMVFNSLLIVSLAFFSYLGNHESKKTNESMKASESVSVNIATHDKKNDCWVEYKGKVFNITPYFGLHPGGDEKLLKYCGQDISKAFASKDQNPPKPHSQAAELILRKFLVK